MSRRTGIRRATGVLAVCLAGLSAAVQSMAAGVTADRLRNADRVAQTQAELAATPIRLCWPSPRVSGAGTESLALA